MNHLTPDELIDAADGTLAPAVQGHLTNCPACRDEAARLRTILLEVKAVDVPEPSPLFWDHFTTRVRHAVDREAAPEPRWVPRWLRWPVLAPIAAIALLVMALSSTVARAPATLTPADPASLSSDDDSSAIGEQEWAIVTEIVGPVEIDQANEAGILVNLGDAERIALQFSADEQRELVRLIKEEMDKAGD